jgi:hypothetical protein
MFLAVILVCTVDNTCAFKALEYPFPNRYQCGLAIDDGVEHFMIIDSVDYAEGRCIGWGQLIGDKG